MRNTHRRHARRALKSVCAVAAIGLAFALSACSASAPPATVPTPTETDSANAEACKQFAAATMTMMQAVRTDKYLEPWNQARIEVDAAYLKAHGDVRDRLQRLMDSWPDFGQITIYRNVDPSNQLLDDIGRACRADGAAVSYRTFSK